MKGILLPRKYLKFPLVKVIVRKIAYKRLITTKNVRFLRTDHRNVVHENFFRGLGDIILFFLAKMQVWKTVPVLF